MVFVITSCSRHLEPKKGFKVISITDAPHSELKYKYVLLCEDTKMTVFSDKEFSIGDFVTFYKATQKVEE